MFHSYTRMCVKFDLVNYQKNQFKYKIILLDNLSSKKW